MDHRGKPLVVIAGPGTGKTSTLVARMVELLLENQSRNISFVTFTRTSRRDTWNKLAKTFNGLLSEDSEAGLPRVSTLHAFAKSLVHRNSSVLGRTSYFSVLVRSRERPLILSEVISDLGFEVSLDEIDSELDKYRSTDSWSSESLLTLDEKQRMLEHFEKLLDFYNTFDIQGLVSSACEILTDSSVPTPPLYLHVDEYQDLNPIDQRFVKLAASHPDSQVVVVGDDAQSIYSFRHANPNGLKDLAQSQDWEKVYFKECHRLPTHILNAAQDLVHDKNYLGACIKRSSSTEKKIPTYMCSSDNYQAIAIAKLITFFLSSRKARDGSDLTYNDFMVLCPGNQFADRMTTILENNSIPTKRPLSQGEIPDDYWRLLLVLRILNRRDNLAFRQWLSEAAFSSQEITCIRHSSMEANESLFDYCGRLNDKRLKILYDTIYILNSRDRELKDLLEILRRSPDLLPTSDLFPEVWLTVDEAAESSSTFGDIIGYVYQKFGLIDSETDVPEEDCVLVTTLHKAKGLEAEFVFISWLEDRYMPSQRMLRNPDTKEEALRLLYVGMTRAQQELVFTFLNRHEQGVGRLREKAMSPFLHKIRHHLDIRDCTKTELRL
jgi:superfamily I DNA/RNA helicase